MAKSLKGFSSSSFDPQLCAILLDSNHGFTNSVSPSISVSKSSSLSFFDSFHDPQLDAILHQDSSISDVNCPNLSFGGDGILNKEDNRSNLPFRGDGILNLDDNFEFPSLLSNRSRVSPIFRSWADTVAAINKKVDSPNSFYPSNPRKSPPPKLVSSSSSSTSFEIFKKKGLCFRCGERYHQVMDCCNPIVCQLCGIVGHVRSRCCLWQREHGFFDNPNWRSGRSTGFYQGGRGRRWSEQFELDRLQNMKILNKGSVVSPLADGVSSRVESVGVVDSHKRHRSPGGVTVPQRSQHQVWRRKTSTDQPKEDAADINGKGVVVEDKRVIDAEAVASKDEDSPPVLDVKDDSEFKKTLQLLRSRPTPYSDAEIKTAFRATAMKYHPDQNQDNKEAAEAKFKEVMASYEAIKSERKNANSC